MAITTFRDTIRQISPWWLKGTLGGRILYAIAVTLDVLADAANAAILARFPNTDDLGALQAIGRERRMQRGRSEPGSTYSGRLIGWLDAHRMRGGPYGLLAQLFAFWSLPAPFVMTLIYFTGRRFTLATDGSVTRDDAPWVPTFAGDDWARWWLYMAWPNVIDSDGLWIDPGLWDDGGLWDIDIADLDVDTVSDLKLVPREWNAAHCKGLVVLLTPGAELWDFPAGTWNDAGVWGGASGLEIITLDPDA